MIPNDAPFYCRPFTLKVNVGTRDGTKNNGEMNKSGLLPTCAEKQKDLHGEELVVGQLQSQELLAHLPHAQTQVVHGRLTHALPGGRRAEPG